MTVLLRSRSLMRGVFHHHHHHHHHQKKGEFDCVITHSHTVTPLSDWEHDGDSYNCGGGSHDLPASDDLPLTIDDCTKADHSRRVEMAKSRGFEYDEAKGVESILHALTPHERTLLADENMPLRHYRAEKGDLEEAIRKIKSTLKWREEFCVEDIKRCFDDDATGTLSPERQKELNRLAEVIAWENETGKIYCRGYDKQGRAILYLTPGRENSTDEINNMRHLVYHLERAIACTKRNSGREKVCIVIGYQGFRLTNAPPLSTVKHTLTILQGHYPERMHRAYICDPPLVFRSFWRVIKMFVDPSTLEKIAFCTGKEGKIVLERDFDTLTTERQAGGTREMREFSSREFLFDTPFDHTFDEKRG
eukprot:CAMPEP_0172557452 /NCGR_PEP_ID=MMETSP1067-20121228/73307_1 /TAXON_ID=265564 ORGANISM="Thalassiosira punctigera, Strain Tpunct2005C2" /NCGR_SAMPLE_ID=MMETSP1067 /ASSEMBLY_ACC=CAM_ASM_000444 /LENGTH=362 /DNA_ID=CAMNT_0013346537 /DNA_START=59 /DNA_END=1147 /DNA_ORIENTATION=+